MAAIIALCSFSAYAATHPITGKEYINSIGSSSDDISILDDSQYEVIGNDTTQDKKSSYATYGVTDEEFSSKCDVYATVAEGGKVYDPENPNADENGFVDGTILVGVPVELIISGTPDENGYYVGSAKGKVKGNISGTTVIHVVPENEVTLTQNGKADITASVNQDFTKFTVPTSSLNGADVNKNVTPAFNDNAVFNLEVKTNQATAGSWHGSFTYTISTASIAA